MTEEFLRKVCFHPAPIGGQEFSRADRCAIKWQYHLWGGFHTALYGAITRADEGNLMKLGMGFPQEVAGFFNWTRGDLFERLQAAFNEFEKEQETV